MPTSSQMLLFALSKSKDDRSDTGTDNSSNNDQQASVSEPRLSRTRSLRLPKSKENTPTPANGSGRGPLTRYGSFRWSRTPTSASSSVRSCESPSNLNALCSPSSVAPKDRLLETIVTQNRNLKEDNEKLVRRVTELELKVTEFESDQKETKESVDFLGSERTVLCETLKETEELLAKERNGRSEERKYIEELSIRTQKLYNKVLEKNEKIKELNSAFAAKEGSVDNLIAEWSKLRNTACEVLNVNFDEIECITIETTIDEIRKFNAFIADQMKSKLAEVDQLKKDVMKLEAEKVALKAECLSGERMKRLKEKNVQNRNNLEDDEEHHEQQTVEALREEIDDLIANHRCADESLNTGLKKQVKNALQNKFAGLANDSIALSEELQKCKESLLIKEELIEKLVANYNRSLKLCKENESKSSREMKRLDEVIDNVIVTLKANNAVVEKCVPLQQLLHQLMQYST